MSINRVAFTKLPFPHFGGKGLGDGGTNFQFGAIAQGQDGILYWQSVIQGYNRLSKDEAVKRLIKAEKIEQKIEVIRKSIDKVRRSLDG